MPREGLAATDATPERDSGAEYVQAEPPRRFFSSPPGVLAVLTAILMIAFVFWRVSAQRQRVESYWGNLLVAGAQLNRVRAEEWHDGQRKTAELIGILAAGDRGPGSAFETAVASALANGDVAYISIRTGAAVMRCTGVPLADHCGEGNTSYVVPSPQRPRVGRVRPTAGGRLYIAALAPIPGRDGKPAGQVTLWLDPERTLFPRLMRTAQTLTGARTVFVSRVGDSATMVTMDPQGEPLPRQRVAVSALPDYLSHQTGDDDWVSARDANGDPVVAGRTYMPSLGWDVYRVMTYATAAAPFRAGIVTESLLAFILGSFVIGLGVSAVRERREQRVRAELMQVRLESLQAQLRPHFLFNALNTIATLIHEDPDKADAMLIRLADLLRLSLEHSDDAEIPLRRELELFDAYIAIERVRFGSSLQVTRHVDPAALDLPVMRWLLQPLAENAIKHGAGYTRGEAKMDLRVTRDAGMIEITLADDGPNPLGPAAAEGTGLRNTRQRLATLYGGAATLVLRKRAGGGTEAVLRIPESQTKLERVVASDEFIAEPRLAR